MSLLQVDLHKDYFHYSEFCKVEFYFYADNFFLLKGLSYIRYILTHTLAYSYNDFFEIAIHVKQSFSYLICCFTQ